MLEDVRVSLLSFAHHVEIRNTTRMGRGQARRKGQAKGRGESCVSEECKVDAIGLPVHELCYVMKLKLSTAQQPIRRRPRP
jgi:hypothetical protein